MATVKILAIRARPARRAYSSGETPRGSRSVGLACARLQQAAESGELVPGTGTDALGRHLAIQLLAVLGMWGSGFFSNRESITQVRQSWCAALLQHCSETSRPALTAAYRATLELKG